MYVAPVFIQIYGGQCLLDIRFSVNSDEISTVVILNIVFAKKAHRRKIIKYSDDDHRYVHQTC